MTLRVPPMRQDDEALRLLAQMYARWFMRASTHPMLEVCEQIRDVLYTAANQQEAFEHLVHMTEMAPETEDSPRNAYARARDIVSQVIEAGGTADALIVGETDGYRHLCLRCSQEEKNFQRVAFFNQQERRALLMPEVWGERRSAYSRCQMCLQPIHPTTLVLFVLSGTEKHAKGCRCGQCNRAGIAYQLTIYACESATQQIVFPSLHRIAAPSRAKCVEQAVKLCWEKGWYMFNKDTVLP
jgi:hypothetical protein